MNNYKLTVLVPVYNEEECLNKFVEEMNLYLKATDFPTKILFIDDGSTDNSGTLIEDICKHNSEYTFLRLKQNSGLSTAIKAGIDNCKTEYLGYIDSDLQTTPMDYLNFFKFLPEFDMVMGIRQKRNDKFIKKISSKIANWFRDTMINDNIEDTGCPLKIIKTDFAKRIPFFDGMHRFIPALIQLEGGKVKQIPIQHFPRFAGTAKYHLWNRIRKPFFDTLAFRWMRKRYINYSISKQSD